MTGADIVRRVRQLVGDDEAVENTWSDDQVLDAVNEACIQFCLLTAATLKRAAFPMPAKDGKATISDNVMHIRRCHYLTSYSLWDAFDAHVASRRMTKTSHDLETRLHSWGNRSLGSPNYTPTTPTNPRWMMNDGQTVKVIPSPNTTGAGVQLTFIEVPQEVDLSPSVGIDPRITPDNHGAIAYLAAAFLLLMDGDDLDAERVKNYWGRFHTLIGAAAVAPDPSI